MGIFGLVDGQENLHNDLLGKVGQPVHRYILSPLSSPIPRGCQSKSMAPLPGVRSLSDIAFVTRRKVSTLMQDEQKGCGSHPPNPARRDAPLRRQGRSERIGESYTSVR